MIFILQFVILILGLAFVAVAGLLIYAFTHHRFHLPWAILLILCLILLIGLIIAAILLHNYLHSPAYVGIKTACQALHE